MGRLLRCLGIGVLLLAAFSAGVATHDAVLLRAADYWCLGGTCGFDDARDRELVDCARFGPDAKRSAVWITAGEANAANFGQMPFAPRGAVFGFDWFDGRCSRARDPLLGADGNGGSVWTRLAERLVQRGDYEQVLIAPVAVGGSALRRWVPGGDLHRRLVEMKLGLDAAGLRATHLLWHQGERDAELGTGTDEYAELFGRLVGSLRELGIDAPVYAAVASACRGPANEAVRAAQRSLPRRLAGVHAGPDTDALGAFAARYDACHFSDAGLDAHAQLWLDALWPAGPATAAGSSDSSE